MRSGIPIDELTTPEFREYANRLFGFTGEERRAFTPAGWLKPERAAPLKEFLERVAEALLRASEDASAPEPADGMVSEPSAD